MPTFSTFPGAVRTQTLRGLYSIIIYKIHNMCMRTHIDACLRMRACMYTCVCVRVYVRAGGVCGRTGVSLMRVHG